MKKKSFTTKVTIGQAVMDNVSMSEAIEKMEALVAEKKFSYVITPNVDHIVKLEKDESLRTVYRHASLILADGMPLLVAARLLGTPLKEKVSGSDLFPTFCEVAAIRGYRLFFLGGRPGAAKRSAEILTEKFTSLNVVGTYSPPFGFEKNPKENNKTIYLIKAAKPDVIFVGLGAPKQENWIYTYRNEYQVPVSAGIGVTFEFISGMVKRAPVWMQNTGLEWFWRLVMEPKRLWKRYLIDDTKFLSIVLQQKFGTKSKPKNTTHL